MARSDAAGRGHAPLWISRPVLNLPDVLGWLRDAGVRKVMPPDQIHVTLATVRTPVDWSGLEPLRDEVVVPAGPKRTEIYGWTVKALSFDHAALTGRHAELARLYPAIDHPRLRAHVSLYKGGRMPTMEYQGPLVLGPERIDEFVAEAALGIKHVKVEDALALAMG